MKILFTLLITAMLTGTSFAQENKDIPTLTEVERLKIEVINLQITLRDEQEKSAQLTTAYGQCRSSVLKDSTSLLRRMQDLKQEIEKNHKGFVFDLETGTFKKK